MFDGPKLFSLIEVLQCKPDVVCHPFEQNHDVRSSCIRLAKIDEHDADSAISTPNRHRRGRPDFNGDRKMVPKL